VKSKISLLYINMYVNVVNMTKLRLSWINENVAIPLLRCDLAHRPNKPAFLLRFSSQSLMQSVFSVVQFHSHFHCSSDLLTELQSERIFYFRSVIIF